MQLKTGSSLLFGLPPAFLPPLLMAITKETKQHLRLSVSYTNYTIHPSLNSHDYYSALCVRLLYNSDLNNMTFNLSNMDTAFTVPFQAFYSNNQFTGFQHTTPYHTHFNAAQPAMSYIIFNPLSNRKYTNTPTKAQSSQNQSNIPLLIFQ